RESANYIGARSFRAAIKPDIKLQPTVDVRTMDAFANGMRSYKRLWIKNDLLTCGNWRRKASTLFARWRQNSQIR
ncbi:hypothetical protein AW081_16125, partial [Escherichia coli]